MAHPVRTGRLRLAAFALVAATALTGCGMSFQTLQPDNNSVGVNAEAGAVKVRNLIVVADAAGNGVVSGGVVSREPDAITQVEAEAVPAAGASGTPLTATLGAPVDLPANTLVVLATLPQPIRVSGSALKPGGLATLTLTFKSGATIRRTTPVDSADHSVYDGVVTARPTASATPTP